MTASVLTPVPSVKRLIILLSVTLVSGLNQGLLLPLLAILLDQRGVSSDLNGINSMALYIGTFSTMFFIEKPIMKIGYKYGILVGIVLAGLGTIMFPFMHALWIWFILRIAVGIGDSALHYCTQLWIVSSSPPQSRGRYISLYGMAYGIGFSIGPMGINFTSIGKWLPFALNTGLFVVIMLLVTRLPSVYPERAEKLETSTNRYWRTYRIAWFALLPAILYGLMEATMNSNFPLYGLRIHLSKEMISMLLPALGVGSLIVMFPLGMLSDRIGRKPVLMACAIAAGMMFFMVPLAGNNAPLLFVLLGLIGGCIGSFFSLGLAYAADLLPRELLPASNVIASIHFSIGSLLGPGISGIGIQYISEKSMFLMLGGAFTLFALIGPLFRRSNMQSRNSSAA
ncbi:putative MFS family arabinose efflux permease [Paenibacillus taihuensis]|uniref:Putative MFS family arabinose efflux permease n=1 Tax=Paenibacillus taihuensis TaxID=1156355 RepID=A0A3D9R3L0_9BACL|nr:MFS transporter [Paenibacillus taihuensis]REE70614.1 putative MFS family arabinose efflux permease [Paenibacillus taihuensis]